MIRVLLVDDHEMFVDGLKSVISKEDGIEVVGGASNGREVLDFLGREKVDIVVMDIEMPEMDGIQTTKWIADHYPGVKVLILSMYNKKQFILNVMRIGAAGYILKNQGKDELVKAIHAITDGISYYSREILQTLSAEETDIVKSRIQEVVKITKREREILRLLGHCKTSNEIAEELFISVHTVESHIRNLLSKLDMPNRLHLVRYAIENGYVGLDFGE